MNKNVPFTKAQKIVEAITAVVLIYMIAGVIFSWTSIPQQVPTHYNAAGIPDAWGGKSSLIFLTIVSVILYGVLTLVSFFPSAWNMPVKATPENYIPVYQTTRSLLCYLKLFIIIMFTYIQLCSIRAKPLGTLFMPFMLISIFGTIIWYFIKTIKVSKK